MYLYINTYSCNPGNGNNFVTGACYKVYENKALISLGIKVGKKDPKMYDRVDRVKDPFLEWA